MALFIFRRDFRVQDNRALKALSEHGAIIPIFIFDPFQLDSSHMYFSQKSLDFMIDCLEELKNIIPLKFFKGEPSEVIKDIIKNNDIETIAFNADYSPYSKVRDDKIKSVCHNINLIIDEVDLILDDTFPSIGKVFGRYEKSEHNVQKPLSAVKNFSNKKIVSKYSIAWNEASLLRKSNAGGGRKNALARIKNFKGYNKARDNASLDTSRMSAYLKYGCVSIREMWHISNNPLYRRQLLWRSYYLITGANRSSDMDGYGHIEDRFRELKWSKNVKHAEALWTGKSGFPLIDAGVRQLINIGWMHNRARLAVANFSVKILHLNPFRDGSPMDVWSGQVQFSKYLIDCCWALNYGNWMWILGPYDVGGYRYGRVNTFGGRMFKDAIVPKSIDPDLAYVRKWVPELESVSDKDLAKWNDPEIRKKYPNVKYEPIVSFDACLEKWYKMTSK